MNVFVSGSIGIAELPDEVKHCIDNACKNGDTFLVGDCSGVDTLVQAYLKSKLYRMVCVYCSGSTMRNFLGSNLAWKTTHVAIPRGITGRAFFTQKDKAMAKDCDCGIAIWNGNSAGTKANIKLLAEQNKPMTVYRTDKSCFEGRKQLCTTDFIQNSTNYEKKRS